MLAVQVQVVLGDGVGHQKSVIGFVLGHLGVTLGHDLVVIEGYVHPQKVAQSALNGVRLGGIAAGLEDDVLDLAPALFVAFTDPDAKERWLGGEAVFKTARARLGFEDAD